MRGGGDRVVEEMMGGGPLCASVFMWGGRRALHSIGVFKHMERWRLYLLVT